MEKKCPMCAEMVKHEAKKCKFCGHLFGMWSLTYVRILYIVVFASILGFHFFSKKSIDDRFIFKNFSSKNSGLTVDSYKIVQKRPILKILGSVKNNGVDSWKFVEVEAKFYDKDNKLVDMTTSRNLPLLKPGESADFKIDGCCGGKESPIVFDYVKLKVSDASYVQKNEE